MDDYLIELQFEDFINYNFNDELGWAECDLAEVFEVEKFEEIIKDAYVDDDGQIKFDNF